MTLRKRQLAALAAASCLVWLVACGEEGQSIGEGQCPVLPLYHWQFTDAGGWQRVTPDGKLLTNTDPIDQSTKDLTGNGRCATPPGYATSTLNGAGGTGGNTGTGGAKNGTGGAKNGTGGSKSRDAGSKG